MTIVEDVKEMGSHERDHDGEVKGWETIYHLQQVLLFLWHESTRPITYDIKPQNRAR